MSYPVKRRGLLMDQMHANGMGVSKRLKVRPPIGWHGYVLVARGLGAGCIASQFCVHGNGTSLPPGSGPSRPRATEYRSPCHPVNLDMHNATPLSVSYWNRSTMIRDDGTAKNSAALSHSGHSMN